MVIIYNYYIIIYIPTCIIYLLLFFLKIKLHILRHFKTHPTKVLFLLREVITTYSTIIKTQTILHKLGHTNFTFEKLRNLIKDSI